MPMKCAKLLHGLFLTPHGRRAKSRNGRDILPMEGASLVASFTQDRQIDRTLIWEHYDSRAISQGKWKLVGRPQKPWELYEIEADRSEMHDLTGKFPENAKELAKRWEREAHRNLIYPKLGGRVNQPSHFPARLIS
jgi:arylsulfatase A-like enzyme